MNKLATGLWRNNADTPEGKYLVKRRDGTVVEWPNFVIGAKDPAAPIALRAYALAAQRLGMNARYVRDVLRLADEFERYRKVIGEGDPDRGRHRQDDPATIAEMRAGAPAEKTMSEYSFDRFRNGRQMAEGVRVHASSLEEAESKAKSLFTPWDHRDVLKLRVAPAEKTATGDYCRDCREPVTGSVHVELVSGKKMCFRCFKRMGEPQAHFARSVAEKTATPTELELDSILQRKVNGELE